MPAAPRIMSSPRRQLNRTILTALVAICYAVICRWSQIMDRMGIGHMGMWFLDMRALLAASDAHQLGIDPAGKNPLDLFHQPHVYSHWWFAFGPMGLTRADYLWLGAALSFMFLAVALLQVRARTLGEVFWSAAILVAPPILLGFNRGNADLFLFILLAATVPCLFSRHRFWHAVAVACILLAANLKYYPVIAGIVLFVPGRPRRERLITLGIFLLLAVAVAVEQAGSIQRYLNETQRPDGLFTFGAGIGIEILGVPDWIDPYAALVAAVIATIFWWRKMPAWNVAAAERRDHLRFILGATVLAASYFATVNYAYRAVFAIFLAPLLWSSWSDNTWPRPYMRLARASSVLLIFLLWFDGLLCLVINLSHAFLNQSADRLIAGLTLAEQPLAAALMLALLGFVVPFVRDELRALFRPGFTTLDSVPAFSEKPKT
jgi:hypothetical protein